MVRFIFGCAFVLGLSILAIPVYYGVAENKAAVTASAEGTGTALSFEEIYEVASEGQEMDATALNAIETAAGGQKEDAFTTGFTGTEDTALQDTPAPVEMTPETVIEDETTTE